MLGGCGVTPDYKRVMIFVDGTNFIAGLERELGIALDAQRPPPTVFTFAAQLFKFVAGAQTGHVMHRRYWCGSYRGNPDDGDRIATELHARNFQPVLLKDVVGKEKGVDMA